MSRTLQEIMYDVRTLVEKYNDDGVILADEDITTLETNGIRFADMVQKELFKVLKNFETYEIANNQVPNLLGLLSNFNLVDFIGDDQEYPETTNGVVGAKAYYFEADNDATIYIEEFSGTWDILETINVTGITKMTAYSGLITPTDASYPVRLRMSGTTFYRHINRCLYSYPFKNGYVPSYRPWIPVTMPTDFGILEDIILEFPQRQYTKDSAYKWEGFNKLYINYFYEGSLRIIYKPIPTTLTALTDVIAINNPTAEQAMINFIASRVSLTSNTDLVALYDDKMKELKFEADREQPSSEECINDVYFQTSYTGGGW